VEVVEEQTQVFLIQEDAVRLVKVMMVELVVLLQLMLEVEAVVVLDQQVVMI
jgi:hypothetical protein